MPGDDRQPDAMFSYVPPEGAGAAPMVVRTPLPSVTAWPRRILRCSGREAVRSANLANKKNSEIASIFLGATYFRASEQKVNAQTISVAFPTHVTSSSLSGATNCSAGFGFNYGVGIETKTYNVGSFGAAIGLSNDMSYTVFQLLQAAATQKAAGAFNANAFTTIFDAINRSGDII